MLRQLAVVVLMSSRAWASPRAVDEASFRAKAMAYLAGNAVVPGEAPNPNFSVELVDLNGDGIPEAFATDSSPESCGSHGCSATVLDLRGPTARSIGDFIAFDITALPTRTGKWRDIAIGGHRQVFRAGKYVHAN